MNKKAIFFSADALIALIIILITITTIYPAVKNTKYQGDNSADIILLLSTLKNGEFNSPAMQTLILDGKIEDLNKSLLEQIGEFYAKGQLSDAKYLADSVFSSLQSTQNYGIWITDQNGNYQLITSYNSTSFEDSSDSVASRQIISGIQQGQNLKGFSSRAVLSSASNVKYFYFGGYVGDGNITAQINIPGNVTDAKIEAAISNNFDLYINGRFSGSYNNATSITTPVVYNITAYAINQSNSYFKPGQNNLTFIGQNLYIAGGFIKIHYLRNSSQEENRQYIPGINGLINIYDGIYFSGKINSINMFLHYNTTLPMYVSLGNTTIYRNSSNGSIHSIQLSNNYLSNVLSYPQLENKTLPLRIGLENLSYIAGRNIYVISVVDLSGGVASARASSGAAGVEAVKEANYLLVKSLLGINNSFLGLVGNHQGSVSSQYSHPLSTNKVTLNNTISTWNNNGNLDLCYGIQNATNALSSIGSSDDFKSMILLGTKFPNSCLGNSGNVMADTYNYACQSWTNHGIKIDTIGIIGNSQSDDNLNTLLRDIASCANGTYYNQSANNNDIVKLYNDTVTNILRLTYFLQTSSASGNIRSVLYPDSYIEVNYTSPATQYGLQINLEQNFLNSTSASFTVPEGSTILNARAISYSGPRWTGLVKINNNLFYNLSIYGNDFTKFGDPYSIGIPNSFINPQNIQNGLNLLTGLGPLNYTAGSISNKIIYSVLKPTVGYSQISPNASGCNWNIQFEDGSIGFIKIPSSYSGGNSCNFNSTAPCQANSQDAVNNAVCTLLQSLDVNNNSRVDVKFLEQDLQITSSEIAGIPYSWNSEIQVRKWR